MEIVEKLEFGKLNCRERQKPNLSSSLEKKGKLPALDLNLGPQLTVCSFKRSLMFSHEFDAKLMSHRLSRLTRIHVSEFRKFSIKIRIQTMNILIIIVEIFMLSYSPTCSYKIDFKFETCPKL